MDELFNMKSQGQEIKIYGECLNDKWTFQMFNKGRKPKNTNAHNWKEVERWLSQYPWKEWKLTIIDKQFEKKLDKLRKAGDKVHLNSQQRIIDLYKRLQQGEELNIDQNAFEYGLHRESIKEVIYHLRDTLSTYHESVEYIQSDKVYKLSSKYKQLQIEDVYMVLILLNESRALISEEKKALKEKLIEDFSLKEKQLLNRFFQTYDFHYKSFPIKPLLPVLQSVIASIREQRFILIRYLKGTKEKQRKIKPLSITYHNHAFYLIGHMIDDKKEYLYPANFRIDRIMEIIILEDRFRVHDKDSYFSAGEFKKQSFNMFSGEKLTVRLKVVKWVEEYVYRTFEDVKKVKESEDFIEMDVSVLSEEGIMFWILGQQDRVEVIAPIEVRERVKERIRKMSKLYNG